MTGASRRGLFFRFSTNVSNVGDVLLLVALEVVLANRVVAVLRSHLVEVEVEVEAKQAQLLHRRACKSVRAAKRSFHSRGSGPAPSLGSSVAVERAVKEEIYCMSTACLTSA